MGLTHYLKPDIPKVVLGLLFFAFASMAPLSICVEGGSTAGFPYTFYTKCNDLGPEGIVPGEVTFNAIALALDMILWYLVASVFVGAYRSASSVSKE
jgi:hypothetical protein